MVDPHTLTLDERWAIVQLGRAWDAFLALPVMHPDDQREFRTLIHHAQEKVLARVALRQLAEDGGCEEGRCRDALAPIEGATLRG